MRLVAMPTNASPDIIFSAQYLPNLRGSSAECFDLLHDLRQPRRDRLGNLQTPQRVVVPESERSYPPLAFELTKLERLERQVLDARNQLSFDGGRNKSG